MSSLQHKWDVTRASARVIQERLRHEVIAEDELGPVRLVAGVDVGFCVMGKGWRCNLFPALSASECGATGVVNEFLRSI